MFKKYYLIVFMFFLEQNTYAKRIQLSIIPEKNTNLAKLVESENKNPEANNSPTLVQKKTATPAEGSTEKRFDIKVHDSKIVSVLLGMTLLGSEWVLWLLIFLSIASLTVIFERVHFYKHTRIDFDNFYHSLTKLLNEKNIESAMKLCKKYPESLESGLSLNGLESSNLPPLGIEKSMLSYLSFKRNKMEKGLSFLGTLGNNAPFIGLFGTVLGIIQSFEKLGENPAGGVSVVMSGISEALVATAVGLFVAIPAVIAFNEFQKVLSIRFNQADSIKELILKYYSQPLG